MAAIVDDEQIVFVVEFLEKRASHARELDLGCSGRDEPYLGIEAVKLIKDVVESLKL